MKKEKIILDCDPGHDDAVAIMLAGINPKIELLGITVVAGRDHRRAVPQACDAADPPGAAQPGP